jgi:hypothetical protein
VTSILANKEARLLRHSPNNDAHIVPRRKRAPRRLKWISDQEVNHLLSVTGGVPVPGQGLAFDDAVVDDLQTRFSAEDYLDNDRWWGHIAPNGEVAEHRDPNRYRPEREPNLSRAGWRFRFPLPPGFVKIT